MTSLVHALPTVARSATHRPRTAPIVAGGIVASLVLAVLAALVVFGVAVLLITGIDTEGRLPHPEPLPAPSAPYPTG